MRPLLAAALAVLLPAAGALAEDAGTAALQGRVMDPLGGVVPGAAVAVKGPTGGRTVRTDSAGAYAIAGLAPGRYTVVVTKEGFSAYTNDTVLLAADHATSLDVSLTLAPVEERVTVKSAAPPISLEPDNNAGALIIKGADLDALPDDPDELAEALQALAGPAAGPSGGQIFIDGFTGGRLPPKSSIREIRINANPFSAEYDRPGFGRIEIFTKPGTDQIRGESSLRFNDDGLNTRNPFAPNKPPYQRKEWGGNLSGPIVAKKASYFVDFEKRDVDDNQIVNATVLDAGLDPVPFNEAVLTPSRRTTVSPRVDWQLAPSQTLTARYTYTSSEQTDAGIGGFSLPTRAYDSAQRQHTLQLSETAVLGKVVNETRLRFWSESQTKAGDDSLPTLQVQDAFTGGGAQVGPSSNDQRRWEVQNVTSWTRGKHSLKAGFRLRTVSEVDVARSGFGGSVVFAGGLGPALDDRGQVVLGADGQPELVPLTSLERYRRTLLLQQLGMTPAAIRALGGGASQFQIVGGNPEARVSQWDLAPFIQDDWRVSSDLLLSAGLRYEVQNNIGSHFNLAPRIGVAWSPGAKGASGPNRSPGSNGASGQARTVIRGGFGIFYDRFGEDLTLRARRFDGVTMQQYFVTDAAVLDQLAYGVDGVVSGLPSAEDLARFALPQTIRTVAADLQAPYTAQTSLSLERQLAGNFTLTGTFLASQGRRLLRSRNVNAPRPDGSRPLGAAAGNVYQVESTGRMNQLQAIVGVNNRLSPKLSVFFRYFLAQARSDTDGADTFPADSYNLSGEYGRAATDVRHRVVLGGNVTGPWGIRVSPYVIASTGRPYNITIGRDSNLDGLFTDRPAFAADPNAPGVRQTPYGRLDPDPAADEVGIPRNLGEGPGFVMMNLRLSRTISLGGKRGGGPRPPRDPEGPRGPGMGGGRFGGEGGRGRGEEGEGGRGLTLSLSAQNVLNHVNPAAPVGNLSSPLFGHSLSSAGGFGFGPGGGGGGGSAAGNRRVELQARLSF